MRNATIDATTVTMDRQGRIVIPKALRDEAGIAPGTPLAITVRDGRIEISPVYPEIRLVERDGWTVAERGGSGPAPHQRARPPHAGGDPGRVHAVVTPTLTAPDTNVVIAALLSWHEFHDRALAALAAAGRAGGRLVLPRPALLQAFSVMTRLPPPHGVPPATARDALTASFRGTAKVVAPTAGSSWALLDDAVLSRVRGSGLHDLEILECAARAGAARLLTFDADDFLRYGDRGVAIVVP